NPEWQQVVRDTGFCIKNWYFSDIVQLAMSRGFVKEDDQEEIPIVPQRAYLPKGVPNLVTPAGMDQLLAEKQMLIHEKENMESRNENERRIELNLINAKLLLLNNRIAEARVVDPEAQPQNEIRFGATVTLKNEMSAAIQVFQIVGVDEADISKGRISFIAPLARALINKKTGDRITLKRDSEDIVFEIREISYR
ncbi:MAG: GreA/GreB family elongation factor, partial [Bacteroidales bacterium]|nr:GreA/GreB family elongation factor [Bacteroidales bacterium]